MAKTAKTAWGIDVGNCALKAIKLGLSGDGPVVLDFAVIEHAKILSQPEITPEERLEIVKTALTAFMVEHNIKGSAVVVSVPGQNSFARFIKLPPVENKRIPEIVRFEAMQQIPFAINDVEWDWQTFRTKESPEVEVGIFAIKKDLVNRALKPFAEAECLIETVQMAPMALYNFLRHDQKSVRRAAGNEAIITLDIGAENTDLIIADGTRVWQRSIPIGGNQFTAALQKAFKLSFAKAEAIKRTANTSKYARQIFQAMRSVFADLAAEIQRSVGFYSSGNREVQFREVLALGNAMKLPGLVKFLQQSLSLPVKRLDHFESLSIGSAVSVSQFTANLPSLGAAYGLALQGVGLGAIKSNLLPREINRLTQWRRKRGWFVAAVAVFVIGALVYFFQEYAQRHDIDEADQSGVALQRYETQIQDNIRKKDEYLTSIDQTRAEIGKRADLYDPQPRTTVPFLFQSICDCLPNEKNNPSQSNFYQAFKTGDREGVMAIPRKKRQQVFISSIKMIYTDDLNQDFNTVLSKWTTVDRMSDGSYMQDSSPMMGRSRMTPRPGMPSGGGAEYNYYGGGDTGQPGAAPAMAAEKISGFVVVIEGSVPHENSERFLSPPNAGLDPAKWGFFNRLRFFGKTFAAIMEEQRKRSATESQTPSSGTEPNATTPSVAPLVVNLTEEQIAADKIASSLPFETYIGTGPLSMYFDQSQGDYIVSDPKINQPIILGIKTVREQDVSGIKAARPREVSEADAWGLTTTPGSAETVYLDPLTFEPVSATYKRDDQGKPILDPAGLPIVERNDYWYRVKFKVRLKNPIPGNPPK